MGKGSIIDLFTQLLNPANAASSDMVPGVPKRSEALSSPNDTYPVEGACICAAANFDCPAWPTSFAAAGCCRCVLHISPSCLMCVLWAGYGRAV